MEDNIPAKRELSSLASTNSYIRELTLPTLYHELDFSGTAKRYIFGAVRAVFTRALQRAGFQEGCPHLLSHRTYRLVGWSNAARYCGCTRDTIHLDPRVFKGYQAYLRFSIRGRDKLAPSPSAFALPSATTHTSNVYFWRNARKHLETLLYMMASSPFPCGNWILTRASYSPLIPTSRTSLRAALFP